MSNALNITQRTSYGELPMPRESGAYFDLYQAARVAVSAAVAAGNLPAAYDTIAFDRKRRASGSAVHHEFYDLCPTTGRVLLCVRESEGSKYGVRTTSKTYYVVLPDGQVQEAPKSIAAKTCKAAGGLGIALALIAPTTA